MALFQQELETWLQPQLGIPLYPVIGPDIDMPFVSYTLANTKIEYFIGGLAYPYRQASYTFGIVAETEAEILAIYDNLANILNGFVGTIGTTTVNEVSIDDVEDEQLEMQGRDCAIQRRVDCTFQHGHDDDVTQYTFTDEYSLKEYLQILLDTWVPASDQQSNITYNETGSGGIYGNSSATIARISNQITTGGIYINGVAIITEVDATTATGGTYANGSATVNMIFRVIPAGGGYCNGTATVAYVPADGWSSGWSSGFR